MRFLGNGDDEGADGTVSEARSGPRALRPKAEQTEDELNQLQSWKTTMEKEFELSEKERKELEQSIGEAKKALEGKQKEIKNLKDGLRQAKEVAVREYHDSNALLSEPGDSFLQGFDDALL